MHVRLNAITANWRKLISDSHSLDPYQCVYPEIFCVSYVLHDAADPSVSPGRGRGSAYDEVVSWNQDALEGYFRILVGCLIGQPASICQLSVRMF